MKDAAERQQQVVQGLLRPDAYPHPVGRVEHIETHISHILLAGDYAYKIKKPVDLGFLDYRSLRRRKHYCHEELRLNRRTAPAIYLDVVSIDGTPETPRISEAMTDAPLEYAVRMRRFPADALLSEYLVSEHWDDGIVDQLAEAIAILHDTAAVVAADQPWGSPEAVRKPVKDNFEALAGQGDARRLQVLADWSEQAGEALQETFSRRRGAGRVRECHGDLHLGNIVMWQGRPCLFDGIEFNDGLRWIDVINDIAFLVMDLEERGRPDLAWRLFNRYLEFTGDYPGVAVLDYYRAYRAMVRAKVAAIRLRQPDLGGDERQAGEQALHDYLSLAEGFSRPRRPLLLLTSGLSGSGKTWVSGMLLESLGLIRLRSDIERKRLFGLAPLEHSESAVDSGIYTAAASHETYRRLLEMAETVIGSGHPVIVDAAFLDSAQRQPFLQLAGRMRVDALIIRCEADPDILRRRILQRQAGGADASEAGIEVLQRQLSHWEAPDEQELAATLVIDTGRDIGREAVVSAVRRRLSL